MAGDTEEKDRKEARLIALALGAMVILGAVTTVFAFPMLVEFHETFLAPGIGLRDAAIIAFVVTIVVLVIFAIAAGDGIIGEIQFMLLGFFAFFVMLWLLIAWIF